MERGYNECSMEIYNQGRKQGEEQARLDCGVNLVREDGYTVKAAAKTCRVDEAKLADYIESCKGANPN